MKQLLVLACALFLFGMNANAQKTRTISAGEITSNTTWYSDTVYTLDGYVYVKNNATLTIQAGTLILGGDASKKSTLIITRNGKINAQGTKYKPIVFSSSKTAGSRAPGDWGGVVILGKAIINRPTDCSTCPGASIAASEAGIQNAVEGDLDNANGDALYGGTDNSHNSGVFSYVRLEFGGVVITPGNEINGLTMGGVGSATQLDHIQVTQANDDGFEWFGGNVNGKYLVSHRNIDDDLDCDFGFTGNVQFAIIQRDSNWYDIGSGPTTNGFECDNDGSGTAARPYTEPTFSNITVVGPLANGTALGFTNSFQNGARLRRNSGVSIFNSIIMGFPDGIFIDGSATGLKHQNDTMYIKNNILAGNLRAVHNSSSPNSSTARSKIFSNSNDSIFSASGILKSPFHYTSPDFTPASGSPALSGASFSGNKINNSFFSSTSYRGAMGSDDWTNCWCNFNPQQSTYNGPVDYTVAYSAGRDTAICSGKSVTLGSTLSGSYTFEWTPSTGLSASNVARPVANPSSNTTYMVKVTNTTTGCTLMDTVVVNVNPTPTASFTSAAGTGAGVMNFTNTSTGASSYSWNFGDGQTSTQTSPSNTFIANGDYIVTLTAINGTCTNVSSRKIYVNSVNSPLKAVAGDITENTTWYADTIYTMNGYVYVKNNATLTIQKGTIIKGGANKGTLIITRNGKIQAVGTKNQPIVFTSNKPVGQRATGDWGGIVMLGKAPINRPTDCSTCPGAAVASGEAGIQNAVEGDLDNANGDALYGGNDANHSSGALSYVRLEFGGIVITPGNEINGLTMGGVGKGTQLDHIQVTQANDDGFEWFGGNVDAKYLVSHRNIDDDLDCDFGYTGNIQFAIIQRDSSWYDIGSGPTTNGFECDNDGSGTGALPYTEPTFSNVTVIGPLAKGTTLSYSNSFQNGARLRRNSAVSIFNSVIMGWPDGIFIDGSGSGVKHQNDTLLFKNNILAGNLRAVHNSSSPNGAAARTKIFANGNDSIFSATGVLNDPFNYTNPNFTPATGSAANTGASFSGNKISNSFFTPTSYRGAMGADDWTECWCKFDPQNENYNSAPINYPTPTAQFVAGTPSGRTVAFTNQSSQATSYLWDFGVSSSTADTSTSENPTFIFPTNGTYTVTLTARNKCGTIVKTLNVVINDISLRPIVDFDYTQGTTPGNREFTFNNKTDEKGFTTTYIWYFGDGQTSTVKSPVHTYASSNAYNVKLVANGTNGSDSVTKTVLVNALSVPGFGVKGYRMYPNPASNSLQIDLAVSSANTQIEIIDVRGRVVKSVTTDMSTINFDLHELNNGVYLVRILQNNQLSADRVVIQK